MLLRIALASALVLALASCAAPATSSEPDLTASPGAQASPEPDQTASQDPTASPQETDGGAAVEHHDVPELEAFLPESIDGFPLSVNSYRGRESIEAGGFDVEDAANSLDRDLDDVSIASATLEGDGLEVFILRIEGATGEEIQQAYHPDLTGYEESAFGSFVGPAPSGGEHYIWVGDELYVEVLTSDRYYRDVILSEFPKPSDP